MELIHTDEKRMWREYCAVVQLPMQQFLDIQNTLLSEQLELVSKSEWHRRFAGGYPPKSIEQYRRVVPLRRWWDYADHLNPDSPDGFDNDLRCWVQPTWSHGSWKRVPWVRRFYDAQCRHAIAAIMMSVARYEGDVRLDKSFRVLPILPDTPFASAWLASGIVQRQVVSDRLAPKEDDSNLSMPKKIQTSLWRSLGTRVDCVVGMTSTLLFTRREFDKMIANTNLRQVNREAGAGVALKWALGRLIRLGRGRSWEPKSLLKPKSIITWGADANLLTPELEAQWGAPAFQMYASSEGGIMAMQDWRRQELVPVPTSVFMEFLPANASPDNEAPVLLDELKDGELYEPVLTSFYGMPFMRLRQGDLLRVTGRNDYGVPCFSFHSRADDIIDLGSIARINRATLTEALAAVGIEDGQWAAKKEYVGNKPVIGLRIDVDPNDIPELKRKLHKAIGAVDPHYKEASYTLRYPLLQITATKIDAESVEAASSPQKEIGAPTPA